MCKSKEERGKTLREKDETTVQNGPLKSKENSPHLSAKGRESLKRNALEDTANSVPKTERNVNRSCLCRFLKRLCAICCCKKSTTNGNDPAKLALKNQQNNRMLSSVNVKDDKNEALPVQRTQEDESVTNSMADLRSMKQKTWRMERLPTMQEVPTISCQIQSIAMPKKEAQEPLSIKPERIYAHRKIKNAKADSHDPLYVTLTSKDDSFEVAEVKTMEAHTKEKDHASQQASKDSKLQSSRSMKRKVKKHESDTGKVSVVRKVSAESTQKDGAKLTSGEKMEKQSAEKTQERSDAAAKKCLPNVH